MSAVVSHDVFQTLVRTLHEVPEGDAADVWPEPQMQLLAEAGGYRWNIPREFGGDGVDSTEMLEIYRELAAGSLLTTFILTQRNAACQRIETSSNRKLAEHLLPALCRGELFATVGISHLTTSRQHLRAPAVAVTEDPAGGGFRLTGSVPWATAALVADLIITGGTLPDGRQILVAVARTAAGVKVHPAMALMGLSSSQTCTVELRDVFVSSEQILHGPMNRVMAVGTGGGAGSLGTSAVAIGTAQGNLKMFAEEVDRRPELADFLIPLQNEADELASQLREAADRDATNAFTFSSEATPGLGGKAVQTPSELLSTESIRRRANSLVIRSAQAWLAATKGAGYMAGHPAERAVRESMFFLVWSCPQMVLEGNLRELSCATPAVI